jgi:prepilin-type N-terminal cleavage/methylation domain-containing protein
MRTRKAFTLIELMIVVIIVGVLAALVIPLLLSRVEKAKYSEGKAIASQIATAVRAYAVEAGLPTENPLLTDDLGFRSNELDAKYFKQINMRVEGVRINDDGTMNFTVTLEPDPDNGLVHGNVVLECLNNETEFTSPDWSTGG